MNKHKSFSFHATAATLSHNHTNIYTMILFVMLFTGFLILTGCDEDTPVDPTPEVSVEAVIEVEPDDPVVGEVVTLDGSSSSVEGADQLSFTWELNPPEDSDAALDNPNAEITTFQTDVRGVYEVMLEVFAADVSDNESRFINVDVAAEMEISDDITTDRTLISETLYRVTSDIDVGAALTIEPGTRIEFAEGAGFTFLDGSSILANGTEDNPIVFTGTQEIPGWWNGIWIYNSNSLINSITHAVIEYGGREALHGSTEPANVTISRSLRQGRLALSNTILRHSGGYGLFIHPSGDLPDSERNMYTNNQAAVGVSASDVHYLDGASDYTGNAEDFVNVSGSDVDSDDVTWQAINVPYRMSGETTVGGVRLTIEPGAEFAFGQSGQLQFSSGSTIIAEGTENNPIVFTGTQQIPGWWNGIWIEGSDSPGNSINHAVIEYGGRRELHGSTEPANLTISRSLRQGRLMLRNTILRHSDGYGLFVHPSGELPDSEGNTYSNNQTAVGVSASHVQYLDGASDYTGNAEDFVNVSGSDVNSDDVTWQALNVPYRMSGETVVGSVMLTIEPGAEFAFEREGQLQFNAGSTIIAEGTPASPIIFTGTQETRGWWNGIWIEGSDSPGNRIDHAVIEYGGREAVHGSTEPANVTVARSLRNGRLVITNSVVRHSEGWGIYVHTNGVVNEDVCDANEFSNNAEGNCKIDG